MTLVPEVVDLAAASGAAVPVLAAGGIGDGRGLAAALALGASGALVGTRFWACSEALAPARAQERGLRAAGDDTVATTVLDRVRGYTWPSGYTSRVLRSPFVQRWHGREDELRGDTLGELATRYHDAVADEDFDTAQIAVGEAIGILAEVRPAAEVVESLAREAERALRGALVSPGEATC